MTNNSATTNADANLSASDTPNTCSNALSCDSEPTPTTAHADSLTAMSCASFAEDLASKKSVPGGGGAAAYAGALASALCSMTGNFTLGKKKYASVKSDISRLLDECERTRVRLLTLVDEDARAFYPLAQAYSIPKDNPKRAQQIEECTKIALQPPLEMMREIAHVIEALEEMQEMGSRMLQSDVGCGATMATSAMQAASLNVFVNTKTLNDREYADAIEREADSLLEYVSRAQAVFDKVNAEIRNA